MCRKLWLLLALFVVLSSGLEDEVEEDIYEFADDDIEERAFLVVRKRVLERSIPERANFTLEVMIYNAGSRAAARVEIKNPAIPAGLEVLEQEAVASPVELINAESSLSFRTVFKSDLTGPLVINPTAVEYSPAVGSDERQISRSTAATVYIMTANEYLVSKVLLMGSYVTFGVLNTRTEWNRFGLVLGGVSIIFVGNYLKDKLMKARQERVRRRAVEMIEKGE